jgi:hypothetical protein
MQIDKWIIQIFHLSLTFWVTDRLSNKMAIRVRSSQNHIYFLFFLFWEKYYQSQLLLLSPCLVRCITLLMPPSYLTFTIASLTCAVSLHPYTTIEPLLLSCLSQGSGVKCNQLSSVVIMIHENCWLLLTSIWYNKPNLFIATAQNKFLKVISKSELPTSNL